MFRIRLRSALGAGMLALLAGCATYGGRGLVPGKATLDDVAREMGKPALRWSNPDGSQQLAYPRGPEGYATFMVLVAPDGTLKSIENVLDERHFAAVKAGNTDRDEILRMFGPPREKIDFPARNDETWEYRFRDVYTFPARFIVVFDKATWLVKETMQFSDVLGGSKEHH